MPSWLLNTTCSSRMAKSPVSLRYWETPMTSQCGSSLKPPPTAVVPLLGQGLVLVIGAAAFELGRGEVENALAGAFGHHVHEAEKILVGIAESEAPADAGFEGRGRARHVEGRHALIGVPDIDHAVGMLVRRRHLNRRRAGLSQCSASLAKAASTFPASRYLAITGATVFLLMVWEPGGSNLSSRGFSQ